MKVWFLVTDKFYSVSKTCIYLAIKTWVKNRPCKHLNLPVTSIIVSIMDTISVNM